MGDLTEGGPFTCIEEIEKSGILSVVMPKDMELSGLAIELETQPSARSLNTGKGTFPVRQGTDGVEEKLLFNEYVLKSFSCAVPDEGQSVSTGENEGTESRSLAYETEYISRGSLLIKKIWNRFDEIIFGAYGSELCLSYGRLGKQAEVTALAVAVTTALLIPEAAEVLKQLILLAWAAGESVVDIRTLLSGNRTALIKSSDTWQLPLSSLLTLGSGTEQIDGSDVPGGITYKDYLRMFLFLKDPDNVNMRVLDRIEENIKTGYGMDGFRADQCITKIEMKNTSEILGGITYTFSSIFRI